jgi:hypothetical protein
MTLDLNDFPILEYDDTREAILSPAHIVKLSPVVDMPERVVLCFFHEVIRAVCQETNAAEIGYLASAAGKNPIYVLTEQEERIACVNPGIGAPKAASFLEELIAHGAGRPTPSTARLAPKSPGARRKGA